MNTQDIVHQAQDVFDRVTHRSSPLLPVHMERRHGIYILCWAFCHCRAVFMLTITELTLETKKKTLFIDYLIFKSHYDTIVVWVAITWISFCR